MSPKKNVEPMHNAHLHIEKKLWDEFVKFAEEDGVAVKALIVDAMEKYRIARNDAKGE